MFRLVLIALLLSGCTTTNVQYHCTEKQKEEVKVQTASCVIAWDGGSGMPAELQADILIQKTFICESQAVAKVCTVEVTDEPID